jgi:hypothetical protein
MPVMRLGRAQTWGWAEAVEASGETDASLRRKLERGQVALPTTEGGRTRVTLKDIAVLRVSRHLCDLGFQVERAFGLAKFAVKELDGADDHVLLYLLTSRSAAGPGGVRVLRFDMTDPGKRAEARRELLHALHDARNVLVPIQGLISDAFYTLPDLPSDVAKRLQTWSANIEVLQSDIRAKGREN